MYGAVDRVPGVCYVGTMCTHFCYLPLIPRGSMIVTGKDGDSYEGVEIPINYKSWAVAWVQVILTGLMVMVGMMMLGLLMSSCDSDPRIRKNAPKDRVALMWVAGVEAGLAGLMALTVFVPGIGRARAKRAKDLAQLVASAQAQAKAQAPRRHPMGHRRV